MDSECVAAVVLVSLYFHPDEVSGLSLVRGVVVENELLLLFICVFLVLEGFV